MATNSETSGDERAQRIAELKRKMQESAQQTKAQNEVEGTAIDTEVEHAEVVSASIATAVAEAEPVSSELDSTEEVTQEAVDSSISTEAMTTESVVESNGAVSVSATTPAIGDSGADEEEDNSQADMTRREFLTYAWGAALGLLTAEAALASYFFMYPRFRAGEFGGKFFLPETDIPSTDAGPAAQVAGKFWLVNTDEGPRALYMVCTHLGCLYKWEASNNRFECPCHGSKFSKAGFYIEGPAPRSLDSFELTEENGQVVVDTGKKSVGTSSMESPSRAVTA